MCCSEVHCEMFIISKNLDLPRVEISIDVSNKEYGMPDRYWSKDFSYLHIKHRFEDINTCGIYIYLSFIYGTHDTVSYSFDFNLKDYIKNRGKVFTLTGNPIDLKKLRIPLKNKFNYVFGSIDLDIEMDTDEDSEAKEINKYAVDYSIWDDCWFKRLMDWWFAPTSGIIHKIQINWDAAVRRPDAFPQKPVTRNFCDRDVNMYLDWQERRDLIEYGVIYKIYQNGWDRYLVSYSLNNETNGFTMTPISTRLEFVNEFDIKKLERLCDVMKGNRIGKQKMRDEVNESYGYHITDCKFNNMYGHIKSTSWGIVIYIEKPYFMIISRNPETCQYVTSFNFELIDKINNYLSHSK